MISVRDASFAIVVAAMLMIAVPSRSEDLTGRKVSSANSTSTAVTADVSSGLVGWWTFDTTNISGSTAFDTSGQGNNGTIHDATTIAGKLDQALSFNGANQYVDIGDPPSLHLMSYTICAWIRPSSLAGEHRIVSNVGFGYGNYNGAVDFLIDYNQKLVILNQFSGGQDTYRSNSRPFQVGTWTHVAATYDSSTGAPHLFVNGQEVSGTFDAGTTLRAPRQDPAYTFKIGATGNLFRYFAGDVDEVLMYNRPLSPSTINEIYLGDGRPHVEAAVVFIPGIMGSYLWQSQFPFLLWPNVFPPSLHLDAQGHSLVPVVPEGILDGISYVVPIPFSNIYGSLMSELGRHYTLGSTLFAFPYDWRLDNRTSAAKLNDFIEDVITQSGRSSVNLVVHSMGGIVARAYVHQFGTSRIGKIIYIGTPQGGSPDAFATLSVSSSLVEKYTLDIGEIGAEVFAGAARTMPSVYQLLPQFEFVRENGSWLDLDKTYGTAPSGLGLLRSSPWIQDAAQFHCEIGAPLSTEQYAIIGSGRATLDHFLSWAVRVSDNFVLREYLAIPGTGDSTVPLRSAQLFVPADHAYYVSGVKHTNLTDNVAVQNQVLALLRGDAGMVDGIFESPTIVPWIVRWLTFSPVVVAVSDSTGRTLQNGQDPSSNRIPESGIYKFPNNETGYLALPDTYEYEITGTNYGVFSFLIQLSANGASNIESMFSNVPVGPSTKGHLAMDAEGRTAGLTIDFDGNGSIDLLLSPNATLSTSDAARGSVLILDRAPIVPGLRNSLAQKLTAAQQALERGQCQVAVKILEAALHELKGAGADPLAPDARGGLQTLVEKLRDSTVSACGQ